MDLQVPVGFDLAIESGVVLDSWVQPKGWSVIWVLTDMTEVVGGLYLLLPPGKLHNVLACFVGGGLSNVRLGAVKAVSNQQEAHELLDVLEKQLYDE